MTLTEIYNLPEGANPSFKFYPLFWDTVAPGFPCPENMSEAFRQYGGAFVKKLDVSKTTDMGNMFQYASNLIKIDGLEDWDVSNVTDMSNMFYIYLHRKNNWHKHRTR